MKARYITFFAIIIGIFVLSQSFSGGDGLKSPTGAPAGHTGSPGDGKNCTFCHGGTASNTAGILTSDVPPTGYIAGSTYNFTVTLTGSGLKGFQASPQNIAGTKLGTLIAGTGAQLNGNGKYITHTQGSNAATATWNFQWVAPASQTGPVTMYIARVMGQPNVAVSSLLLNENYSVGIADFRKDDFNIFPNPADRYFMVDLNLSKSGRVVVEAYSLSGQKAEVLFDGELSAGEQNLRFDHQLLTGAYIVNMITPDGTFGKKMIITN